MNTSQSSQSSQQVERVCGTCDRKFIQYQGGAPQRSCPSCLDLIQRRPTVILSRKVVGQWPAVLIDTLPTPWSFTPPWLKTRDTGIYTISRKGNVLSGEGSWSGRLVIRASHPYSRNDLVSIRAMRAIHIDRLTGKKRDREYLVLSDPQERPSHLPSLIYLDIDLSMEEIVNNSMWSKQLFAGGTTENGRPHYTDSAVLCIVDRKHTIKIVTKDSGSYVIPGGE